VSVIAIASVSVRNPWFRARRARDRSLQAHRTRRLARSLQLRRAPTLRRLAAMTVALAEAEAGVGAAVKIVVHVVGKRGSEVSIRKQYRRT
jgi:hypothetical protein